MLNKKHFSPGFFKHLALTTSAAVIGGALGFLVPPRKDQPNNQERLITAQLYTGPQYGEPPPSGKAGALLTKSEYLYLNSNRLRKLVGQLDIIELQNLIKSCTEESEKTLKMVCLQELGKRGLQGGSLFQELSDDDQLYVSSWKMANEILAQFPGNITGALDTAKEISPRILATAFDTVFQSESLSLDEKRSIFQYATREDNHLTAFPDFEIHLSQFAGKMIGEGADIKEILETLNPNQRKLAILQGSARKPDEPSSIWHNRVDKILAQTYTLEDSANLLSGLGREAIPRIKAFIAENTSRADEVWKSWAAQNPATSLELLADPSIAYPLSLGIFNSGGAGGAATLAILSKVDSSAREMLLQSGEVPLHGATISDVLTISTLFSVNEVTELIDATINKNFTIQNATLLIEEVTNLPDSPIKQHTFDYLASKWAKIEPAHLVDCILNDQDGALTKYLPLALENWSASDQQSFGLWRDQNGMTSGMSFQTLASTILARDKGGE